MTRVPVSAASRSTKLSALIPDGWIEDEQTEQEPEEKTDTRIPGVPTVGHGDPPREGHGVIPTLTRGPEQMTTIEARARVARGAVLLDEKFPGWFRAIDIGTLDLTHACLCVIGQVRGNFYRDISRFTGENIAQSEFPKAEALGFWTAIKNPDGTYRDVADDYRTLQDAWIEAIADRLVVVEGQQAGAEVRELPCPTGV